MQLIKSKRLILLLVTFSSILAFGVTTSFAQEKVKVKRRAFGIQIKSERVKVDDTEGHFMVLSEWKGATSDGEFTRYGTSTGDIIKGNGPYNGYMKYVDKAGNTYIAKYQGMLTTTKSPEGKPITTFKGKFENIEGGGTYKGRFIGKGIYMMDAEGEYVIKK